MRRKGKLENIKTEMDKMKIKTTGMCEIRWKGAVSMFHEGYGLIYSRGEERGKGIGTIFLKMFNTCKKKSNCARSSFCCTAWRKAI